MCYVSYELCIFIVVICSSMEFIVRVRKEVLVDKLSKFFKCIDNVLYIMVDLIEILLWLIKVDKGLLIIFVI